MTKKYVILTDCYGNKLELTEQQAKEHVIVNGNNMIWAIHPFQQYKDGDWVELCFLPTYNGIWDEELQENVFCPETWDEDNEDEPLTIFRHYYHNLALSHEKPRYGFTSSWKSDEEKDPNAMYSYEKEWVFEEA